VKEEKEEESTRTSDTPMAMAFSKVWPAETERRASEAPCIKTQNWLVYKKQLKKAASSPRTIRQIDKSTRQ
jgi:hypothetical protein